LAFQRWFSYVKQVVLGSVIVSSESGIRLDVGSAGERLARAREASGLTIAEIAASTRIQARHLSALEVGNFAALPGRSYVVGFAKSFARVVGEDEASIAAAIAAEYAATAPDADTSSTPAFAPGDPARVPSSRFAWAAAAALAVVGVGGFVWWENTHAAGEGLPSLVPEEKPAAIIPVPPSAPLPSVGASAVPVAAPAQPSGTVVLTAQIDKLWVKITDGAGKQLLQKQLTKGESYTLPADAANPKLWTGRPDALAITIGGKAVPALTKEQKIVKDVPVSAAALLARPAPVATVAPTPGAKPSATATHSAPRPHVRHAAPPASVEAAPAPAATPVNPSTAPQ